jgi:hypothetical protein
MNVRIVIVENVFKNNFAMIANSAMQIYTQSSSLPYDTIIGCKGIHLEKNQFLQNSGCPSTMFTAALACRFSEAAGLSQDTVNWPSIFFYQYTNSY